MNPTHRALLQDLAAAAKTSSSVEALMRFIADRLHAKMTRYNWVGFYVVDPTDSHYLNVGPYAGSFTPNTRIPLDTGLCGAAATSGKVIVVQDVTSDPRYLPGSSLVKSEIVVPIFANKRLAAEMDAESYFPATFERQEQEFVEACAGLVGEFLSKK
jgi:L-methionine (R)-S-oxide reductase